MIRNLFTLLLVCAFTLCNAAELKDYSLVIPDNAPYELRLAAKELAHYAEKITAKKMNVNGTDAKIIVRIDPAQKDLLYDGYKIFTQKNGDILITGSSAKGAEFGLYAFMEELGVRFYLPGAGGTYVPPCNPAFKLPEFKIKSNPVFQSRYLYAPTAFDADWHRHNRMLHRYHCHHNLTSFISIEKYAKTHPEYFAYNEAKKRHEIPAVYYKAQPCMTNPEVINIIAEQVIEYFNKNPEELSIDLGMNDGTFFCQCKKCKEVTGTPRRNSLGLRDYSRLAVHFYNAIAEKVAAVHPDKCIGILGYNNLRDLPADVKYHPNVIVGHVMFFNIYFDPATVEKCFSSLPELTSKCKRVAVYTYNYGNMLIPSFPIRIFDKYISEAAKAGATGYFAEAIPHWPSDGIKHYLTMKKLWDPSLDSEKLLQEYAKKMFAPADREILEFYEIARKAWEEQNIKFPSSAHLITNTSSQLKLIDGKKAQQMLACLESALRKAPNAQGIPYLKKQITQMQFLVELNKLQDMWKSASVDVDAMLKQYDKAEALAVQVRSPRYRSQMYNFLSKESILALRDKAPQGKNLVKNPSFAKEKLNYTNPTFRTKGMFIDWRLTENWGGKRIAEAENGVLTFEGLSGQFGYPPFPMISQSVAVEPDTWYRFSVEYRNEGFPGDPYYGIVGWSHYMHSPEWRPLVREFKTSARQKTANVSFGLVGLGKVQFRNPALVRIDKPSFKENAVYKMTGVVPEAAAVIPEKLILDNTVKTAKIVPQTWRLYSYAPGSLKYTFTGSYDLEFRFPAPEGTVTLLARFNGGAWKVVPVRGNSARVSVPEGTHFGQFLYKKAGKTVEVIPVAK